MSNEQKPFFSWRHALLKSELGPTTKHVLLTLSCHMNDMGEGCFPSTKTITEETSLSERAVITHLMLAASSGWIRRSVHGYGNNRYARNEYRIAWPDGGSDAITAGEMVGNESKRAAGKKGVSAAMRGLQAKREAKKLAEGRSASKPDDLLNVVPKLAEGRSADLLKDVQRSTSKNSSKSTSTTEAVPFSPGGGPPSRTTSVKSKRCGSTSSTPASWRSQSTS